MSPIKSLPIFFSIFLAALLSTSTHAATFNIKSNCPYTVWAAAVPGGGRQMNRGDNWTISANPGQTGARIWARTGCTVTGPNGLRCNTGDCDGLLQCTGYGTPPNTLAEYTLKQYNNLDFFDISLVDGFNVPMNFLPISNGCTKGPTCTADINGQCPDELKTNGGCNEKYSCTHGNRTSPSHMDVFLLLCFDVGSTIHVREGSTTSASTQELLGCNNPCTVFKTDQYCCNSGRCDPTNYSMYFKNLCPTAYSYPMDDATSTFTCPSGTNYQVTFCP